MDLPHLKPKQMMEQMLPHRPQNKLKSLSISVVKKTISIATRKAGMAIEEVRVGLLQLPIYLSAPKRFYDDSIVGGNMR